MNTSAIFENFGPMVRTGGGGGGVQVYDAFEKTDHIEMIYMGKGYRGWDPDY